VRGLLAIAQAPAATGTTAVSTKVEMQWLGQAGARIVSPGDQLIVVDPWIKGGPKAPATYKADLVLIPIAGNFTMDPEAVAFALNTWTKPKMVIPMHYNSNPLMPGTLAEFQAAMKGSSVKIFPMTEGQTLSF